MQKYNAIFCVNKSIQMQLSFCHFSLCLLYSMQMQFYLRLTTHESLMWNLLYLFLVIDECSVLGMNVFSCFFPTYFKFLILYYVRPILSLFKKRKRHFLEFIFQDPELCFTIASILVYLNPCSFDSLFFQCCLIIMFHYYWHIR